MTNIITTIAAMSVLLLILPSLHLFDYHTAYSQMNMPRSQNLSSLLKNLLGPQKQVSGHYSNPQFGITDIVSPIALAQPQMTLQVLNNSDLAGVEEKNPQAFSISKVCNPLAPNTTSVIDGRSFNVAT